MAKRCENPTPEQLANRERQRLYRERNRERNAARQAAYKNSNRETILAKGAEYRKAHREELTAKAREYRAENLEECRRRNRDWQKNNPDKHNAKAARRRARVRDQIGEGVDWVAIDHLYALAKRLEAITGVPYEVDHVVPIALGGLHHQNNLVVMTSELNRRKGKELVKEIIDFFCSDAA